MKSGVGCCNTTINNNKPTQRLGVTVLLALLILVLFPATFALAANAQSDSSSIAADTAVEIQPASSSVAADTQPASPETFDHLATGFPLEGEHERLECEQCHIGGLFEELPIQCEKCHDNVFAAGQPATHIVTTAPCESCHTPVSFTVSATALFDHSTVSAQACKECHNGVNATGMGPNHLVIGPMDCNECHTINSWVVDRFDHAFVDTSTCNAVGCHSAADKTGSHPLTSDICHVCHMDTNSWSVLVSPFNHDPEYVLQHNCVSAGCHNANDKSPTHAPTTNVCEACHSNTAWSPILRMDHDQIANISNCVSSGCHSVNDKSPTHPQTKDLCEACHSPGLWTPVLTPFDHTDVLQPNCASSGCHNSGDKAGNHPPTTDNCEACHSNSGWIPVISPFEHGETLTITCETARCHDASDKSVNHPPTPDICSACHQSPADWSQVSFDHSLVSGSCWAAGCHNTRGQIRTRLSRAQRRALPAKRVR